MEPTEQPDLKEERERLAFVLSLLHRRLVKAEKDRAEQLSGLSETRRDEFTERQEPLLRNLWAAHRFEDLVHLSQEFQSAAEEEKDQEHTLRLISSLKKMEEAPYFARIDLRFDEEDDAERIYIGRHSLWDDEKRDLLVYDWRAPIASVFYRFKTGPASYSAPAVKIDCTLLLKRQFEIQGGRLIGFFDADTVIQDSFLRRLLAQHASSRMKSIVETIQRDQDAAVRDEEHSLLMIQGAAGSGKTSIAMHRAAFLMYEGLKNPLRAHHILILSPNTVFEKYISGVLPELGESSVATSTLEELLEKKLGMPVETRAERWEALCENAERGAVRRKSLEIKSSRAFITLLDRFAAGLPSRLPWRDLQYAGRTLVTAREFKNRIMAHGNAFPLDVRLLRAEKALWEQVHELRPARLDELRMMAFRLGHGEEYARGCSIWESGVLAKEVSRITRLDYAALYFGLLRSERDLRRLGKDLGLPEDLSFLAGKTGPPPQRLLLEDAAAIAYLKMKLTFGESAGDIRQLVVDEAQDYSPMDYALIRFLFPRARFTVVGDVNQALEMNPGLSLYTGIAELLGFEDSALLELKKSFRCTREILDFSLRFLPKVQVDSLNRSGDPPRVLPTRSLSDEIAFCREKGYQSIALIVRTLKDAEEWKNRLSLPVLGRSAQVKDVFLAPLCLAKGLEFDAALVLDCDGAHYDGPAGRRQLYAACTRALHHLALFSEDGTCPLLSEEDDRA